MSNSLVIIGLFAAVVTLPLLWAIVVYNSLVRLGNKVAEAWRDVDVQLQRRHDLIPNLGEVVEGYAEYEREALTQIAELRSQASAEQGRTDLAAKEDALGEALDLLVARVEANPELRAVESFRKLQDELADTEDELAAARRIYNGNVLLYNNRVQAFPSSLVASYLDFELAEPFAADEPVRLPVALSQS